MYKLGITIYKEFLLLKRDVSGLILLFLMPLVLVITVTLIQDSTIRQLSDSKIEILVIDKDSDVLSESIISNLKKNDLFDVVSELNGEMIDENQANDLVLKGRYPLAIVIPNKMTANLDAKVSQNVEKILKEFEMDEDSIIDNIEILPQQIKLYFDPATQLSFRNGIKNAINLMVSKIETKTVYQILQRELEIEDELLESSDFITFLDINPRQNDKEIKPNSVQHNVPAWALFAIFFMVIPLSINIVKEKNQGTYVRLKTNPVAYRTILGGKILVYLTVCLLQFILLLLVGLYLFPYFGLPSLDINGSYFYLFIVAAFSGLAAIGFGILLGTIAETQEQSAPFGATATVILAAIGGVWVPVYLMPKFMQIVAEFSPMNWGLKGFYDVILRNCNFSDILPEITLLGLFFITMLSLAIYYDKMKNAI